MDDLNANRGATINEETENQDKPLLSKRSSNSTKDPKEKKNVSFITQQRSQTSDYYLTLKELEEFK